MTENRALRLVSDHDVTLAERVAFHLGQLDTVPGYANRVLPHVPIVVGCPTCKAQPSDPCRSPKGWSPRNGFHAPRMTAVAGWSREQKLAEYARMKAAEDLRRGAAS